MSIDFFKKLNWAFGLIALGLFFGVAFVCATLEIKDLDLWLHLRMGEFIVRNGFVPSTDILSASFLGKPWVNHEWLFQVVVHLVREGWGFDGLIYMQAGVVLLTFLLMLMLVYNKDRHLVFLPVLFLVLQVYHTRFTIRPDIFSLFFFIIYVFILSIHLNKSWSVWVLFLLQVVWVNMHGYSLWGIIFVLIGLTAETLKRRTPLPYEWNAIARLTDDEYRRLGLITAALIAAMFCNPMGIEGALYPLRTLLGVTGDSKVFFEFITELQRPVSWKTLFDTGDQMAFKSLILLSFISFIFNRRKIDISALILWVVFLAFSLTALRNMTYFAFTAFLVIGYNLAEIRFNDVIPFRFSEPKFFYVTGAIILALMSIRLMDYANEVTVRGYYDFDKYERKSELLGICQRNFPEKAVQFLIDSGIKGNFFNDFNSGAYMIGRVFPNIMVYMDGRTELRGPAFFKEYQKIWSEGNAETFDKAVKQYHLSGLFINTAGSSASSRLLKLIASRPEWHPVYFDYDALIMLKDIPRNQPWISKYAIDLFMWRGVPLDLQKVGAARVIPYRNVRRARTLYDMGFIEAAEVEAEAALKVLPEYDAAYKILGDISAKRGDFLKAFENFRQACIYDGSNPAYRLDLGRTYLELNNPVKAIGQFNISLEIDPKNVEAKYFLAKAYLKNKQTDQACDILTSISTGKAEGSDFKDRAGALLNEIRDKEKK